jgi:hypothetical protein
VLVQLDVVVYGQFLHELHDYILKPGEQVVAETVRVNVTVVTITKEQAAVTMLPNQLLQHRGVNIQYVQQAMVLVADLNVTVVLVVLVTLTDLT